MLGCMNEIIKEDLFNFINKNTILKTTRLKTLKNMKDNKVLKMAHPSDLIFFQKTRNNVPSILLCDSFLLNFDYFSIVVNEIVRRLREASRNK